jgi:hypothetical protein
MDSGKIRKLAREGSSLTKAIPSRLKVREVWSTKI